MNLELALALAEQGIYVFPCVGEGPNPKQPCRGVGWKALSTTDPRVIAAWWAKFPNAAPAIDCGKSGLIAVDCDRKLADGLAWIREQGIDPDAAPGSITPSGGRHLVYRNTIGAGNGRGSLPGKEIADIDIRGDGGFILAPGATFVEGGSYQPIGRLEDAPPLPALLAEMLQSVRHDLNGEVFEPLSFTVHSEPVSDIRKHHYGQTAMAELERDLAGAPEGNRNNEAARIAFKVGQLVGGGCIDPGEAYGRLETAALSWGIGARDKALGARGTIWRAIQAGMGEPRGPTEERSAVVINLRGGGGGGGGKPKPEQPEQPEQPEPGATILPFATPYSWTEPETIPKRDWLYGTLLVRKFVSMTVAPGGTGKSSLVTTEALAQVSGEDLLEVTPPRPLRVWLWNLEDPYEEITRKIQATAKRYGLKAANLGDRLFVNSGRDTSLVVAKTVSGHTTLIPGVVEQLVAEIQRLAIDIVVIDPFVSCNEVQENDNGGQDKVIKAWARVAELGNCAVHLVDHARKVQAGTELTAGSNRGASAKVDGCRVVRVINPMSPKEAEEAGIGLDEYRRYFRAINDKANLAPPAERSDWFKLDSVNLGNGLKVVLGGIEIAYGDSVGVVTAWEYPKLSEATNGVDWAVVEAALVGGPWRESSQASDWVGRPLMAALGIDAPKVKRMLKVWRQDGVLEDYVDRDERRKPVKFTRIKVTAPPAPPP